ncbi:MAG: hypothetical protein CHACPFDD_00926 [Phycisphaerae bacterium]|nr:hypothetical protein [Phycisphaerae bacterium]
MINVRTLLVLIALATLAGCPQGQTPDLTGNSGTSGLSADEQDAVAGALAGIEALVNGVSASQGVPSAVSGETSATIPTDIAIGTCPEVTLSASGQGALVFTAVIDFGDGCTPYGDSDYTCSGSATGTFDSLAQSVDVTFDGLECNGAELDGDAGLTYEIGQSQVALVGDFDLTFRDSGGTVEASGDGSIDHVGGDAPVTTFNEFAGTVTADNQSWTLGVENLPVSYATYGNFVPFGGNITLSASSIRTIVIRFNEDSPVDGSIEVSIGGGEFTETTLDELADLAL